MVRMKKWLLCFVAWGILAYPGYADQVYTGDVFRERIAFATNEFYISSVTPEFTVNIFLNGVLQESHDGDSYMFTLEGTGAAARLVSYASFAPSVPGLLEFSFSGVDPTNSELLEYTDSYTVLPAPTTNDRDAIGGWIASVSDRVQAASDYLQVKFTDTKSEVDANEALLNALQTAVGTTLPAQITGTQNAIGGWIANTTGEINANEAKIDVIDGIVDSIVANTGTDIPARITAARNVIGGWVANATTEINANETKIDVIDGIVDAILADTGTDIPSSLSTMESNILSSVSTVGTNVTTTRNVIGGWIDSVSDVVVPYGTTLSDILADTGTDLPAQISGMVAGNQIANATMLFSNIDMDPNDLWIPANPIIRSCSASLGGSQDYSSILVNEFDDGTYELSVYDYRVAGLDTVQRRFVYTAANWNEVLAIIRRATPDGLESHYGL